MAVKSILLGLSSLWASAVLAQSGAAQIDNLRLGEQDADAPLYASLPQSVRDAGQIVTGIIIGTPPSQFVEPNTKELQGFNIDLMRALSTQLGVPFQVVPTDYGAFIPGLQSRRFDMVSAFIADTESRQQVVDFIDYYATTDLALAHRDATFFIKTMADLCGRSVAIDQGNYLINQVQDQVKKCQAEGRGALRLDIFQREASARQAVMTRRSDLTLSSGASALYTVKVTKGLIKIASEGIGEPVLVGYPLLKGREPLRDVMLQAFARIMENGEYMRILRQWGLQAGALDKPMLNQGPNASRVLNHGNTQ